MAEEYKYLPPLTQFQRTHDEKWQEYKIEGKNINARSHSSMTLHNNL